MRASSAIRRTQYLTAVDLRERYHCSRMWLHRRIVKSGLPHGYHLGGSKELRWRLDEVEAWEANPGNHPKPAINVERPPVAGGDVARTPGMRRSMSAFGV